MKITTAKEAPWTIEFEARFRNFLTAPLRRLFFQFQVTADMSQMTQSASACDSFRFNICDSSKSGGFVEVSDGLLRDSLSRREIQIAKLYAGGLTYRQIAEQLHRSPSTIRNHVNRIYQKLEVNSKIEFSF